MDFVLRHFRISSIEWYSLFYFGLLSLLADLDFEGGPWAQMLVTSWLGVMVHWLPEILALYSDQQNGFYRGKLERALNSRVRAEFWDTNQNNWTTILFVLWRDYLFLHDGCNIDLLLPCAGRSRKCWHIGDLSLPALLQMRSSCFRELPRLSRFWDTEMYLWPVVSAYEITCLIFKRTEAQGDADKW